MPKRDFSDLIAKVRATMRCDQEEAEEIIVDMVEGHLSALPHGLVPVRQFQIVDSVDVYTDPNVGGHYEDSNDDLDTDDGGLC